MNVLKHYFLSIYLSIYLLSHTGINTDMRNKNGFVQMLNAQALVSGKKKYT